MNSAACCYFEDNFLREAKVEQRQRSVPPRPSARRLLGRYRVVRGLGEEQQRSQQLRLRLYFVLKRGTEGCTALSVWSQRKKPKARAVKCTHTPRRLLLRAAAWATALPDVITKNRPALDFLKDESGTDWWTIIHFTRCKLQCCNLRHRFFVIRLDRSRYH